MNTRLCITCKHFHFNVFDTDEGSHTKICAVNTCDKGHTHWHVECGDYDKKDRGQL